MEKKQLTTWVTRKKYIYASAALIGTFGILTLILPHFGFAGVWLAIMTGLATAASIIYLFVHIYIIFYNDCKDF